MNNTMIEMIGYAGSGLVLVSMLMTSVVKLRIINTVGCVIFCIYAVIIKSYPTAVMNFFLIIINIYNLSKLTRKNTNYDFYECGPDEATVGYLLSFYGDDIKKYFANIGQWDKAYVVCREGTPVGMMLGEVQEDEFKTVADYTTPMYRDCSVGAFLYEKLHELGIGSISCDGNQTEAHAGYLTGMGFAKEGGRYVKRL